MSPQALAGSDGVAATRLRNVLRRSDASDTDSLSSSVRERANRVAMDDRVVEFVEYDDDEDTEVRMSGGDVSGSGDDSAGAVAEVPMHRLSLRTSASDRALAQLLPHVVIGPNCSYTGRWALRSRDGTKLYVFGIIDMLQAFNMQKKMERAVKVGLLCKDRDGISVQDPRTYAKRFVFSMSAISTGRQHQEGELQDMIRASMH